MAVLIRHRAEGMTEAQYDEISPPLVEKLKTQPGFLFHTAFTDNGQFTVSEIWESQEQHDQLVRCERRAEPADGRPAGGRPAPLRPHALGA